jgi:hypothetical protein
MEPCLVLFDSQAYRERVEPALKNFFAGGAEGGILRLLQVTGQQVSDLELRVCHLSPGTRNKIEHRLFSFISQNWRGKPLVTHQVIVDLIAASSTKAGLKVRAQLHIDLAAH